MLSALKYQGLNWFGICGAIITLFTGLKGIIELADWTRWLIDHWVEFAHGFWNELLAFLGVSIPRAQAIALSFVFFGIAIALGSRFSSSRSHVQANEGRRLSIIRVLMAFLLGPITYLIAGISLIFVLSVLDFPREGQPLTSYVMLLTANALALLLMFGITKIILQVNIADILSLWGLYSLIFALLFVAPLEGVKIGAADEPFLLFDLIAVPTLPPVLMLLIGRSRPLVKRLSLVLVGVMLLVGLNKFSKF